MISIIQKLVLLSLPYYSIFQNPDYAQKIENTPQVYKIIEINRSNKRVNGTNKAYIILVQDTVSKDFYTVVSLKSNDKTTLKIKKGEFFNFSINRYYKNDYFIKLGLKLSIYIDETLINIPMSEYTTNIYTTTNLKGLYYHNP